MRPQLASLGRTAFKGRARVSTGRAVRLWEDLVDSGGAHGWQGRVILSLLRVSASVETGFFYVYRLAVVLLLGGPKWRRKLPIFVPLRGRLFKQVTGKFRGWWCSFLLVLRARNFLLASLQELTEGFSRRSL